MGNRGEKKKKKGKKLIQKGKKGGREIEKMEDGEKKVEHAKQTSPISPAKDTTT